MVRENYIFDATACPGEDFTTAKMMMCPATDVHDKVRILQSMLPPPCICQSYTVVQKQSCCTEQKLTCELGVPRTELPQSHSDSGLGHLCWHRDYRHAF